MRLHKLVSLRAMYIISRENNQFNVLKNRNNYITYAAYNIKQLMHRLVYLEMHIHLFTYVNYNMTMAHIVV